MGRPASGKSTLAKGVETELRKQDLDIENLDGDEIRKNLHPDLGFSREDRATNNRRTAFICKLLNRNGISVVNAMITPFRDSQREARDIIEPDGEFVLVYVKCSVVEAKRRDQKGLYADAEAGNIDKFTGINHPFQKPHNPEIIVDTESTSEGEAIEYVLERLQEWALFDDEPSIDYQFDITKQEENDIKNRLSSLGYLSKNENE
jgi:adenylylsulfate kinase